MPAFKRYRNADGAEFTSALTPKAAEEKGWKDVTSATNPAVGSDGKPLRDKPADRKAVSKAAAAKTPQTNTPKEG